MIRIAIVGTGGMAKAHAESYAAIPGCTTVAAVDIDPVRARDFGTLHGIRNTFESVEELLANCEFDAASVVTPDAFHVPCALPLVMAGKHVLCEKPIAPTAAEALPLVSAAEKAGTINMINFSYRNAACLHYARALVATGGLGEIRHFQAHYLQSWLSSTVWGDWRTSPQWLWRCSSEHGSKGALGDIGVHIVDLATFAANSDIRSVNGSLKTFAKAKDDRIGEYHLDANDSSLMRVELENGGVGTITTSRWATGQVNSLALSLYGDRGALRLDLDKSEKSLEVCLGKDIHQAKWKTVKCPKTPSIYQRFISSIVSGKNDPSDFRRGWTIQRALDACFESDESGTTVSL